jgi:hypothetical protein
VEKEKGHLERAKYGGATPKFGGKIADYWLTLQQAVAVNWQAANEKLQRRDDREQTDFCCCIV